MKNRLFYISLTLSVIVLVISIIAYPALPNKIPVHWGLNGEPNRYGSKLEHLFLSALPLLLLFLFNFLPSIDPKKEAYKKHSKAYSILILFIIIFLSGMDILALCSAMGYNVKFSIVVPIFLGILFIGIGNYMSQIRPNYFVGFRTPWTLASEHVWRKTHRFGGYVFIIIGIVPFSSIIVAGFGMKLFLGALVLGIGAIYIYSYLIFTKSHGK